jgi:hypothetical protein
VVCELPGSRSPRNQCRNYRGRLYIDCKPANPHSLARDVIGSQWATWYFYRVFMVQGRYGRCGLAWNSALSNIERGLTASNAFQTNMKLLTPNVPECIAGTESQTCWISPSRSQAHTQ